MHAETPEPVCRIPITSSSSWIVPSSPSRPCRAMNAISGRAASICSTRSPPTSTGTTSCPSRSSASWTRAPDRSDTWRSSERPPLSTATLIELSLGALARQPQDVAERLRVRRSVRLARSAVQLRGLHDGMLAGERSVQGDLLAHDLAQALDTLADLVLADAREVQAHRGAAAPV